MKLKSVNTSALSINNMAFNRHGMDLKAIKRDQRAIDKLPNKSRVMTAHEKALVGKKEKSKKPKFFASQMEQHGGFPKSAVKKAQAYERKHNI